MIFQKAGNFKLLNSQCHFNCVLWRLSLYMSLNLKTTKEAWSRGQWLRIKSEMSSFQTFLSITRTRPNSFDVSKWRENSNYESRIPSVHWQKRKKTKMKKKQKPEQIPLLLTSISEKNADICPHLKQSRITNLSCNEVHWPDFMMSHFRD